MLTELESLTVIIAKINPTPLGPVIKKMKSLKKLTISGHQLMNIPDEIWELKELEELKKLSVLDKKFNINLSP